MDLEEIRDYLANREFGMDYDQIGTMEKEWVNDEIVSRLVDIYEKEVYKVPKYL